MHASSHHVMYNDNHHQQQHIHNGGRQSHNAFVNSGNHHASVMEDSSRGSLRATSYYQELHVDAPTSNSGVSMHASTYSQGSFGGSHSPPQSPSAYSGKSYRKSNHGYHPYAPSTTSIVNHGIEHAHRKAFSPPTTGFPEYRTSPLHSSQQAFGKTSPHSPNSKKSNTCVPSILEMMGTTPPSYSMGPNNTCQFVNNNRPHINNISTIPSSQHERLDSSTISHRYHPYRKIENSPNPSPVRVASIISAGPALPGASMREPTFSSSAERYQSENVNRGYSSPSQFRDEAKVYDNVPNSSGVTVKEEIMDRGQPNSSSVLENNSWNQEVKHQQPPVEEHTSKPVMEDIKVEKKASHEYSANSSEPLVDIFLTFVTTSGTQSPTTRISIPRSLSVHQLKDQILMRLYKNADEENDILQLGKFTLLGNVMLKKDENNYIEIDEQFCRIYRFEQHDSLKASLLN